MSNDDEIAQLAEVRDALGERTPFGTVQMAPTAPLAPFSQAAMTAADNLLVKAVSRLRRGDRVAADKLIARAAEIPFDDHERWWPGLNMATVQVYSVLADQSELIADHHDFEDDIVVEAPFEIDVVVRSITRDLSAVEGAALHYAIDEILTASDYHGIDRHQQKRISTVQAMLPQGEYDRDLGPDASPRQRVELIAAACRVAALMLDSIDDY